MPKASTETRKPRSRRRCRTSCRHLRLPARRQVPWRWPRCARRSGSSRRKGLDVSGSVHLGRSLFGASAQRLTFKHRPAPVARVETDSPSHSQRCFDRRNCDDGRQAMPTADPVDLVLASTDRLVGPRRQSAWLLLLHQAPGGLPSLNVPGRCANVAHGLHDLHAAHRRPALQISAQRHHPAEDL